MGKEIINPFFITSKIPKAYFCDREIETEKLIQYVTNGNNVVLVSPRRMGKSGLIHHCYENPCIKKNYAAIYFDIFQTTSLREFVYLFGKTVYENVVPKTTKWITKFLTVIKSLNGKISIDPISGFPSFSMTLGAIKHPLLTLEEIFYFIENFDRKCIIAIDEFQQISKYPEKNVEAILRTHIQQMNNANFIYSGSERHIMIQMFASYNRPFYQSSSFIFLEPIPKEVYVKFARNLFLKNSKKVDIEALNKLYDLFEGTTFFIQKILNQSYLTLKDDSECNITFLNSIIDYVLETNAPTYRFLLSNLPEKQKELLYAIALSGTARNITSLEFIRKYSLISSSSVQSATKQLLEKDFISKIEDGYSLSDKFFSLWIKKLYEPYHIFLT